MQNARNIHLLYNRVFIPGLFLLALNDHVLKWQFSNWLTGKLSDFTGLLILPMFLGFLFPRLTRFAALLSGLFFIFWKLPLSESFISFYNRFALIPLVRTVDYTDLLALSILPLSHYLVQRVEHFSFRLPAQSSLSPLWLLVPASLVFMATSPPISYYMKPAGDIHIGQSFKLKISKGKALEKLRSQGFVVRRDTSQQNRGSLEYYLLENIVLAAGKDSIRSVQFAFYGDTAKPLFFLNNVSLRGDWKISDWRVLKQYSKHYKKLVQKEIIEELNRKESH